MNFYSFVLNSVKKQKNLKFKRDEFMQGKSTRGELKKSSCGTEQLKKFTS